LGKMNVRAFAILLVFAAGAAAADGRLLLARFEVLSGALEGRLEERQAVIFYTRGGEVEIERIGKPKSYAPMPIGSLSSKRLLERLKKIEFPEIDYQKHFDALARRPVRPGKSVVSLDGAQIEVEMNVNGTRVFFRMWNPDGFLYSHDDDRAASAVNAAVEAFVLSVGKSVIYFQ